MTSLQRKYRPVVSLDFISVRMIVTLFAFAVSPALPAFAGKIFDDAFQPKPGEQPIVQPMPGGKPLPTENELTKPRTLLKELFATQLADTSMAGRRKLARSLLDEVPNTPDSPVDQYAMTLGGLNAAREGASLPICFEAIGLLAKMYRVDTLRAKTDAASTISLKADAPAVAEENVLTVLSLVAELAGAEEFESAARLCGLLKPIVGKQSAIWDAYAKRAKEVDDAASLFARLRSSPDDAGANLAVGSYYAFTRDRWAKALPFLVKGSDSELAAAAKEEMTGATGPGRATIVGGGWWDAAEKQSEPAKGKLRRHAVALYNDAVGEATGLRKALFEKRIAEVAKVVDVAGPGKIAVAAEWIDLFNGKDTTGWHAVPMYDGVVGPTGTVEDGVLTLSGDRGIFMTDRGDFGDFTLRAEAMIVGRGNSGLLFRVQKDQAGQYFEADILNDPGRARPDALSGTLLKSPFTILSAVPRPSPIEPDRWFTMEVAAKGTQLSVAIDGRKVSEFDDPDMTLLQGAVGLQLFSRGTVVKIKKVQIKVPPQEPEQQKPGGKSNPAKPAGRGNLTMLQTLDAADETVKGIFSGHPKICEHSEFRKPFDELVATLKKLKETVQSGKPITRGDAEIVRRRVDAAVKGAFDASKIIHGFVGVDKDIADQLKDMADKISGSASTK